MSKVLAFNQVKEMFLIHNSRLAYDTLYNFTNFTMAKNRIKNETNKLIFEFFNFDNSFGGTQRFLFGQYANSTKILYLDDDLILEYNLFEELHNKSNIDKDQLYGPYIRSCDGKGYHYKPSRIPINNRILTGLCLTSTNVTINFVRHFHLYAKDLYETNGNGEDLLFNFDFIKTFGKFPIKIGSERHIRKYKTIDKIFGYTEVGYENRKNHLEIRTNICKNYVFNNQIVNQEIAIIP